MSKRTIIFLAMGIGFVIAGSIPVRFGSGFFSLLTIIFGAIGAVIGLLVAYKLLG